jgi:Domain of unknown function (DUF1816)
MSEVLMNILNSLGLAYWVEVRTDRPRCTYYFGPFWNAKEAKTSLSGYIEDLESEGAKGINTEIKRFKPNDLTIFDESSDRLDFKPIPRFSGQF